MVCFAPARLASESVAGRKARAGRHNWNVGLPWCDLSRITIGCCNSSTYVSKEFHTFIPGLGQGTMEHWNSGFWETATVVFWQNPIDKEVNKMRNIHVRSSPLTAGSSTFQHPSIPLFQVQGNTQQPQKTPLISICCRNSETLS